MNAHSLKACLLILFLTLSQYTFSQSADSTQTVGHFGGAVTVTNNGISLLPTFALGKPAIMFDLSAGKKRLSFEPQFRFSLEGKPWSFLFWWRYKVVDNKKFKLNIGAHPAISFKTVVPVNEPGNEMLVSKRFLAGEVAPTLSLSKNASIGLYYLHAHGFDLNTTKATHFLALRSNLSNIRLTEKMYFQVSPQIYYLKLDEKDGLYATSTFTLVKKGFPVKIQSIVNKTIQTNIAAKKALVWNVSLIYSFNKEYIAK